MWTKFKRWLIRKLGGCVAPYNTSYSDRIYLHTFNEFAYPIETIRTMWRLDDPMWVNCPNPHDIVRRSVVHDIVERIIYGNYIKLEEHDGFIYGSLKVVKQPQ